MTALHYASRCGHHDTVRVLLERGADPNTHDLVSRYFTCVVYAILCQSMGKSMYEFSTVVLFVQ